MAITGDAFTTYLKSNYIPGAIQTIFWNNIFLAPESPFEVVPAAMCPAGPEINQLIDYATTTNAEAYVRGAPMPDPDSLSSVRVYSNKDFYQVSAKVYRDAVSQAKGQGGTHVAINMHEKAIDNAVRNLIDKVSATWLTDLAAQVDSTTALGDGSASRATYSLASLETAVSGVLTAAALEDTIESLQGTTYGVPTVPREEDLVWLVPRNQKTNISRLNGGSTNYNAFWSSQSPEPIDGSRLHRTKRYADVDVLVVPDMTTTEIYCVRKDSLKIYMHEDVSVVPKDVAEWADAYLGTCGSNLWVSNVRCAAKLTGVTA